MLVVERAYPVVGIALLGICRPMYVFTLPAAIAEPPKPPL
jgi:hypothetical protein